MDNEKQEFSLLTEVGIPGMNELGINPEADNKVCPICGHLKSDCIDKRIN